jgi:hypothetical protein
MKRTLAAVALALSCLTFTTSPVLAETQEDPNAVDVSRWRNSVQERCYTNGLRTLWQISTYSHWPLYRKIDRFYKGNELIGERHYVEFDGEKKFEAFYVKRENTWTRYSADENGEANKELNTLFIPDGIVGESPCKDLPS